MGQPYRRSYQIWSCHEYRSAPGRRSDMSMLQFDENGCSPHPADVLHTGRCAAARRGSRPPRRPARRARTRHRFGTRLPRGVLGRRCRGQRCCPRPRPERADERRRPRPDRDPAVGQNRRRRCPGAAVPGRCFRCRGVDPGLRVRSRHPAGPGGTAARAAAWWTCSRPRHRLGLRGVARRRSPAASPRHGRLGGAPRSPPSALHVAGAAPSRRVPGDRAAPDPVVQSRYEPNTFSALNMEMIARFVSRPTGIDRRGCRCLDGRPAGARRGGRLPVQREPVLLPRRR